MDKKEILKTYNIMKETIIGRLGESYEKEISSWLRAATLCVWSANGQYADGYAEALDNLQPGTELILYRESDNKYDKWAIAVHLTEDDKLGFITRFKNETIARLMDVGKKFIAVVDDPAEDAEAAEIAEKENRRNRNAATENMAIPFSVYMIEDV